MTGWLNRVFMFTCIAVGMGVLTAGMWIVLTVTVQFVGLILFIVMSSDTMEYDKQIEKIRFMSALIANTGAVAVFIALVVFVVRVNKIKT